ncbi:hypothetical protein, partial [Ruegeria sp. HKCCD8929]|uniref:gp53-like domain-containing protein n=1 Tax=Ruegeria sp. HKCCD8929 TaxID=2683006 RepID=UPI001C2C9101
LIAIGYYDPPVNKPKDTVSALIRIHVVFSDLQNLILQVQGTDAYVPVERKVSPGVGMTGGGDMSLDRVLTVDFATKAEAEAGVSETKVISPKRLSEALAAAGSVVLSADGYQILPSGLIIQWRSVEVNGEETVTLPITFPNGIFHAYVSDHITDGSVGNAHYLGTNTLTNSSVNVVSLRHSDLTASGSTVRLLAFGY